MKLLILLALCTPAFAQGWIGHTEVITSAPSGTCVPGIISVDTVGKGLYVCPSTGTWGAPAISSATVPSGSIVLTLSACPQGFSEVASLAGKMLRGTVVANANVNTAGGSATITPTGSVAAPTFTGSSGTVPAQTFTGSAGTVPAQTFTGSQVTTSATSGGTPAGTNGTVSFTPTGTNGTSVFTPTGTNGTATTGATSGGTPAGTISALTTGADSSTTGGVAKAIAQTPNFTGSALGTHTHTVPAETFTGSAGTVPAQTFTGSAGTVPAETFTGSALGTHTHTDTAAGTNSTAAFTPAGTNSTASFTPSGTVSAPTFTGNAIDPSPAYINVIFCSAN